MKRILTFILLITVCYSLAGQSVRKHRKVGEKLFEAQNYERAIDELSRGLELASSDEKTLVLRAECYKKNNQPEKALKDYRSLHQFYPKDETYMLNASELHYQLRNYKDGLILAEKALLRKRKNLRANMLKVDHLAALNKYKQARKAASDLLKVDLNEQTYFRTATVDYALENYRDAEIFFRKALQINNKNINTMIWLARTLDKREKYRIGLAHCIEAIKIDPRNIEVYEIKSMINEHTLNFNDAIDDLNRILAMNHKHLKTYNKRAELYTKINENNKAVSDWKKIIELDPTYFQTYENLAKHFNDKNNHKEAAKYYQLIVENFSGMPAYTEKLAEARKMIVKLNPETNEPEIALNSHNEDNGKIKIASVGEKLLFTITDESEILTVSINNTKSKPDKPTNKFQAVHYANSTSEQIKISATDIHGNTANEEYQLRTKQQQIAQANQYASMGNVAYRFTPNCDVDKDIPETGVQSKYIFALIIGNEDYATKQNGLRSEVNVDYARNDAYAFKLYAEKVLGVTDSRMTFLTDATSGEMRQATNKFLLLMEKTKGKGTFYFYYAGHGLPHEKTKEPYLIPSDMNGKNLNGAIALNNFYEEMAKHKTKKTVVFIDACFSGGARNTPLVAARGVKIVPRKTKLKGSMVAFTASNEDQSSLPYHEKKHGMFTYFLLKKLKETEGNATLKEVTDYVKEQVDIESILINDKEQTPFVGVSPSLGNSWHNWTFID
ncbi:MAG: caspase family protein [Salinivirgaceae bacterium]|jgi:tetratricopeptide (TPR) repeat protein|nr:caspase family protein [Salinivirgaceae bacterium]